MHRLHSKNSWNSLRYVRSNLEYASSVWDPGYVTLINSLEIVQNRSVRFIISDYYCTASVNNMKGTLHIPSLASHIKLSRLTLSRDVLSQSCAEIMFHRIPDSIRVAHHHKVRIPFQCTTTYSSSFLPKTCADWNHLLTHWLLPQTLIFSRCTYKPYLKCTPLHLICLSYRFFPFMLVT